MHEELFEIIEELENLVSDINNDRFDKKEVKDSLLEIRSKCIAQIRTVRTVVQLLREEGVDKWTKV